jgi:hypothetical protein
MAAPIEGDIAGRVFANIGHERDLVCCSDHWFIPGKVRPESPVLVAHCAVAFGETRGFGG